MNFLSKIKVGHYHKSSFISTVMINFNRAYWTIKIMKKFGNTNDSMFDCISLKKIGRFVIEFIIISFKRPPQESFFRFVKSFSWQAGVIWSYFC